MTTKAPTPVEVPITITPIGLPTTGPQSVPPGPGTTGQVPTVPTPVGPLEKAPPPVATGQTIETTATIPVPEIPVDISASAAITTSVPKPIYIRVSSDNTVVTDNTRVLNFMGPGVSVSGTSSQANITITGSGPGGSPGGSNTQIQFNNSGLFGGSANLTFDVSTRVLSVGGSASATGNITGSYILGNGSQLTGLPATYSNSNVTTLLAGFGSNTISTTGNVTAGYLFGNGSQLTGLAATYGNANVATFLAAFGSNTVVTTGNITGGNISTGVVTLTNGATIRDTAGDAVAFGRSAGLTTQGDSAVAIGNSAGQATQGAQGVAIGWYAGNTSQAPQSVAIGTQAGYTGQGSLAVAIGIQSGYDTQGNNSVAIGRNAGYITQGANAVAIGSRAGLSSQANNSIIINATGNTLNQTTANTFTVAPVRNDVANTAQVMFYNTTSKEITYGNTISVTGNITGSYFIGNGSQLTGIVATSSYGNANVAANLAAFGSNPVSTTGNVTAGNFIGNVVGGGAGTPTISSATNLDLSAAAAVRVVGGGTLRLPNLTTAQVANIIASNGDMVYNTTTNKIQAYANGAWGNITLS